MTHNFIEIKHNTLSFVFGKTNNATSPSSPESFDITFQRTLRIPDDNKKYALPPSLGNFPLAHVEDHPENLPSAWSEHGGIFFPMYQAEAMWMNFKSRSGRPYAVKIASGKVNAVSGEVWHNELKGTPGKKTNTVERRITASMDNASSSAPKQDYMVSPPQPWLDGFNAGKEMIRQFVAVPLDSGYTVEEQVTGKAEFGGIQIIVYPMKDDVWAKMQEERAAARKFSSDDMAFAMCASTESVSPKSFGGVLRSASRSVAQSAPDMGLGAGGMMKQSIAEDQYGVDAWDTTQPLRVFVHLANSIQYTAITGKTPPTQPFTPSDYQRMGYPWFDYYTDSASLPASDTLSKVDSIASMQVKKGEQILPDEGVSPSPYQTPIMLGKKTVKDKKSW